MSVSHAALSSETTFCPLNFLRGSVILSVTEISFISTSLQAVFSTKTRSKRRIRAQTCQKVGYLRVKVLDDVLGCGQEEQGVVIPVEKPAKLLVPHILECQERG